MNQIGIMKKFVGREITDYVKLPQLIFNQYLQICITVLLVKKSVLKLLISHQSALLF